MLFLTLFDIFVYLWYYLFILTKRGGYMEKLGNIIVSVYKDENNKTNFQIQTDSEDILPVSYVIEDTLKMY